MRYGICAGIEEAETVKAAGFDYLEMNVLDGLRPLEKENPVPEALQRLQKVGISCEGLNILLPGTHRVTGPEVDEEKLTSYLKVVGERAGQLGVKVIVFGSGGARRVPDGFPRDKAAEQILWFMRRAGEALAPHRITLVLEPLCKWDSNVIPLVSEGAGYVRKAAHPSVKLLADSYHMAVENESWEVLKEVGGILAHAHVSDPDRKPPGATDFDYRPFLRNLREGGYQGRLSIEAEWENLAAQAPKALAVLRENEKEISVN